MLQCRGVQILTWHVSRNFHMNVIITQCVYVKGKVCPNRRHANARGVNTCSYGVHVSNVYAYLSIIILFILLLLLYFAVF
jgi:hypothetical protein